MADIKDLREKMAKIATEARAKMSEVSDKTDEARAAEVEREFDAMMAEHDRLAGVAERMQKAEAALRSAQDIDVSRRPVAEARQAPAVDEGFKVDYRQAFYTMIANGGLDGLDAKCAMFCVALKFALKPLAPRPLVATPFRPNWLLSLKRP